MIIKLLYSAIPRKDYELAALYIIHIDMTVKKPH